jgi:gliding motility-associated protein GldC
MSTVSKSQIKIDVTLDENKVPEKISWEATQGAGAGKAKAFILSFWDEDQENSMSIDLWNKEMSIYDMQRFFHQTLLTMSDTFDRATGQNENAAEIRAFARKFALKTGLLNE